MPERTVLLLSGLALVLVLALLLAAGLRLWAQRAPASPEALARAYAAPAPPPPAAGLRVFHLGHSLVGRDMPAMLEQLAPPDHRFESQLGWGTSLKEHWEPGATINGFDTENAHPRFRPAREAVASGDYDAVILTEMVELRDAIRYHDSGRYLAAWAALARKADPETRIYLYETWHRLDDPEGWLARLDRDFSRDWLGRLVAADLARNAPERPIYLIPAGQVMAAFVRELEARGGVEGIASRRDLFSDEIHPNDLGAYLVALTHYAVLYQRSPVGLPHALTRADGTPAEAPGPEVARLMQETVWRVVRALPETGVAR